jgi:hypothetical protein
MPVHCKEKKTLHFCTDQYTLSPPLNSSPLTITIVPKVMSFNQGVSKNLKENHFGGTYVSALTRFEFCFTQKKQFP